MTKFGKHDDGKWRRFCLPWRGKWKQLSKWQKGDHKGVELACTNPGVCGWYSRRSWSHQRHILAACYFGVFEAKRTSRLFCYSRSPTTAAKLPAHLGWCRWVFLFLVFVFLCLSPVLPPFLLACSSCSLCLSFLSSLCVACLLFFLFLFVFLPPLLLSLYSLCLGPLILFACLDLTAYSIVIFPSTFLDCARFLFFWQERALCRRQTRLPETPHGGVHRKATAGLSAAWCCCRLTKLKTAAPELLDSPHALDREGLLRL